MPSGSAHAPASCSTQKAALTHGEPLSAAMLTFSYVLASDLNAGVDSIKWGVTGLIGGVDKPSQVFYTLAAVTSVNTNSNNSGTGSPVNTNSNSNSNSGETSTAGGGSTTASVPLSTTAAGNGWTVITVAWVACVISWLVAFTE